GVRAAMTLLAAGALLFVAGGARSADEAAGMQRLVALVSVQFGGSAELNGGGAGVVFAATPERMYMVTAAHVVRAQGHGASDIELQFGEGKPLVHAQLSQFDADLDIAVLTVDQPRKAGLDIDNLPFDRLATAGTVRRGDQVFMMGKRGDHLSVNVTPDRVSSVSDKTIAIESNFIVRGFSGGPLFSDRWQLLGMIVSDDPPEGTARPLPAILSKLKQWGLPVDLRVPRVRVSSGSHVSCRLDSDGAARCWGGLEFDEPLLSDGRLAIPGVRWTSLGVGLHNLCGIDVAGAAWCLGQNPTGQLGNGATAASMASAVRVAGGIVFTAVSVGDHACGIAIDGSGWCWGQGDNGELGNDSNVNSTVPVQVAGALTFRSISAGLLHTCGISSDGRAWCWGSNELAEFGDKNLLVVQKPLVMAGDVRFETVGAGYTHTCGLATDGAAYCWGQNEYGQLGDGTHTDHRTPVRVLGEQRYVSLVTAITGSYSCGLTAEGTAWCWGLNNYGQLGNGSKSDSSNRPVAMSGGLRFASISAGRFHGCGVTRDDAVWCWGGFGGLGSITRDDPSRVPVRVD
ncbi:MAG TPA: trypsin-like peptidase domain-containing protein, partial [Steroidobacteraceae bacterium]|nr:trypsin-like peptidase domain-containing protein [Steroidobacteraceae bacterium]